MKISTELIKKNLNSPDEVRSFPNGRMDYVTLGDITMAKMVLEPGWSWERDIKPIVNTESCQVAHEDYILSGRIMIRMDNGQEIELGPGDACVIPPGHTAWVIGSDPCEVLDFSSQVQQYAQPSMEREADWDEIINIE